MCAILVTNDLRVTRNKFVLALAMMRHRGPDSSDNVCEWRDFKLGHNRLSILDLDSRSDQPYEYDNRYVIVYNGEIYNFKELKIKYNIETHTECDTEVLVALYSVLGKDMLEELDGMFAFVIVDKLTNEMFVARDRLGIKPLYYYEYCGKYIFSSELAPIKALVDNLTLDSLALRQYRKLRCFFNGRTIFNEIKMFPAAHWMSKNEFHRYWDLDLTPQEVPSNEEIYHLVNCSIKNRCLADVSVGSYLSGGLDSSIVACLSDVSHTWAVGFDQLNEFEYSAYVAAQIKTHHRDVLLQPQEFLSLAELMIERRSEPLSVPNEVLIFKMTQEVSKFNKVVLSGEGADELFWGYDRIFKWANDGRDDLVTGFDKMYSYGSGTDYDIIEDVLSPFMRYGSKADIVAAFFQIAHLHGLLRRLDSSTMLCSVEARVPFCDHKLVERMAGVSYHDRNRNGVVKSILKESFIDIIPEIIIKREKVGFPVPLTDIFSCASDNAMDAWFDFNLKQLNLI